MAAAPLSALLLLLLLLLSAPCHAQNAIVNGGFETGDLTGWTPSSAASGSCEGVVEAECHTGSYCFQYCDGDSGDYDALGQQVALTPNSVFQLSLWLYSDGSTDWNLRVEQSFGWFGEQLLALSAENTDVELQWAQYCVQFASDGSGSTTLEFSGNSAVSSPPVHGPICEGDCFEAVQATASNNEPILIDDVSILYLGPGSMVTQGASPCVESSSSSSSSSTGLPPSSSSSSSMLPSSSAQSLTLDTIVNGGFEDGDLTGWAVTLASGTADAGIYSLDSREGNYCFLYYNGDVNQETTLAQVLQVTPGRVFRLSLWLMVRGSDYYTFTVTQDGSQQLLSLQNDYDAHFPNYVQYCAYFSSPGGDSPISSTLQFTTGNSIQSVSVYLDDISLELLPPGTEATTGPTSCPAIASNPSNPVNEIANGGFEDGLYMADWTVVRASDGKAGLYYSDCHTGYWCFDFVGQQEEEVDTLEQTVTVTAGGVLQLSLWLTAFSCTGWTFTVMQNGIQLFTLSDDAAVCGEEWIEFCAQFTADSSGSVTFQMLGSAGGAPLLLDDISLQLLPEGAVAGEGLISCVPVSSSTGLPSSSSSSSSSSSLPLPSSAESSSLSSSSLSSSSGSSMVSSSSPLGSSSSTGSSAFSSSSTSSSSPSATSSSSSAAASSSASPSSLPSSSSSSSSSLPLPLPSSSSSSSGTAPAGCTLLTLDAFPRDSLIMCLQMLVQAYPLAAGFTDGLRYDVSASLAQSYHLPDDIFVQAILVLQPVETGTSFSRRLLSVAVEVPMVVLGNVSETVNVTGISAASLVSLFIAQVADDGFFSNSTGAVILSQAVTVIGWPSSSSSTGELRATGAEAESDLTTGQTAGIIVAVLAVTIILSAVYLWVYKHGCAARCRRAMSHTRMDSKDWANPAAAAAAADGSVAPAQYQQQGESSEHEGETAEYEMVTIHR